MPRYRGNLNNYASGQYTDLVGEKMTTTLETLSGDIVCEAFTIAGANGSMDNVDHIRVTVRGHAFAGVGKRPEIVLYNGPLDMLHDEAKRDLFITQLAEAKLKKEYGK